MGSKKTSSTRTVNVPEWLDSRNKDLISRAEAVSNTPYQAYGGQRIADFTPDQLKAFQMTRDSTGKYQGLIDQATQGVSDLYGRVNGPSADELQNLMNPYIQNVLDSTKRDEVQRQQMGMQDLMRSSALAGSFGGSRFALEKQFQDDNNQRRLTDIQNQGMSAAYNDAQGLYNQGTNVLSNAIGMGMNTAQQGQAYDQADIRALLGIGNQQQIQDQSGLDINYQDWLTEQAYPYQQLQYYQSFLQPYTQQYAGDTTTQKTSGGGFGQALGAGLSLAGMFATGGALNPMTMGGLGAMMGLGGSTPYGSAFQQNGIPPMKPMKEGGEVKAYADGGVVDTGMDFSNFLMDSSPRFNSVGDLNSGEFGDGKLPRLYSQPDDNIFTTTGKGLVNIPVDAINAIGSGINSAGELPEYLYKTPASKVKQDVIDLFSSGAPQSIKDRVAAVDQALGGPPQLPGSTDKGYVNDLGTANADVNAVEAAMNTPKGGASAPSSDLSVTDQLMKRLIAQSDKPIDNPNYQKYNFLGYEGTINMPVFKAGLAMMASDGDFFESLAAGGSAFASQLENSSKSKDQKEAERLKNLGDASDAELKLLHELNYGKQVEKSGQKSGNPWDSQMAMLKMLMLAQNLKKGKAVTSQEEYIANALANSAE